MVSLFDSIVSEVQDISLDPKAWGGYSDFTELLETHEYCYHDNILTDGISKAFLSALIRDKGKNLELYEVAMNAICKALEVSKGG